ncbi:unnamed protein product [Closterium sp. Yama58-4]|nr:unnamed protein product [Closterium sp. Yama58-4]
MATDAPPAAVPAADAAADAGAGTSAAATEKLSEALVPIHKELLDLRDTLKAMQAAKTPPTEEALQPLQERLDAVDNKRVDGIFGGSLKTVIPEGQAILHELMDEAYDLVGELVVKASEMPPEMKQIYDTLCGLKRKLQKMKADRSYSLEDIHHYQLMVDAIDSRRVDGIFAGNLQSIPPGQAQCSTVLFQVYELLRILLGSAHDMNAEMRGIYTHLIGIKRKLIELKSKHIKHSTEDLHIYQLQLDAIDRDRVEGIFGGSPKTGIPAGQAVCSTLLAQCFKLVQDLQETATDVANMKWDSSRSLSIPSSPSHPLNADSRFASVPTIPQSVPATRPAAPKRGSSGSFKERLQPVSSRAASAASPALAVPAIPVATAAADSDAATRLSGANSAGFGGGSSLGDRFGTRSEGYGSENFFWRVDARAQELVAQWRDITDLAASAPPPPPPPLVALERRLDEAEEWLGAAAAALGALSRSFVRAAAARFPRGQRWENAAAPSRRQARLSVESGRSPVGLRGVKVRLAVSGKQAEAKEAEERRLLQAAAVWWVRWNRVADRRRASRPHPDASHQQQWPARRAQDRSERVLRNYGERRLEGLLSRQRGELSASGAAQGSGALHVRDAEAPAVPPGPPVAARSAAPVSGAAAGLAGTLLTYPLELIRTRISVQPELYRDLGSTVRKIVQEEGALSLYRGLVPSLLGVVPYAATNYFVYDALRTAYRKATGREHVPNEATLLFGAAAASASSAVTFPLEVVRRRLQLGVTAAGAGVAGRQTAITILRGIVETEGVLAVYRGLGTTWLKLLPAAGISFVCYEAARVALRVDDASMARGQEKKGGSSSSSSSSAGGW